MAKAVVIDGKSRRIIEPKKPSTVRYVELPDEQPAELFQFQDEPGGAQYMDAALQGVMAELGERDDDAKVTVKRRSIVNGAPREEWLYECHPAAFSIPELQSAYGAGEYRVTVYGKQEGSNYKIVHADKKIAIGDAPGVKKDGALAGIVQVAAPVAPDFPKIIGEALAGPLTALANVVAQAIPKQASRTEMLAEMKLMAELFTPARAAPAADPMDMLTRAVSLLKNAAPAITPPPLNEDGEVTPTYLLSKGIELVQSMMEAAKKQGGAVPALPAPATPGANQNLSLAPQPAEQAANTTHQSPTVSEGDAVKLGLKMQLVVLLNAAKMDAEPNTYAVLIYEQAPDEVIATLQKSDWFAELVKLEPGFAAHQAWAEKVRAEVLEMLEEDAKGEGADLTPTDEAGKTAADALAGTSGKL